jgi:hypothetical protein
MSAALEYFGGEIWKQITRSPLGSLTKREMEVTLLRTAIQSGLVEPRPETLAAMCSIPMTRAHGYLTDLALRQAPLTNQDGIERIAALLSESELVRAESLLSILLHDAALRIWLERKMVILHLNAGDTLRRDHVKLTPSGLAKLIGASDGILSSYDALNTLPKELQASEWVKTAKKSWKKGMGWVEAMSILGNTASGTQSVIPVLFRSLGA